MPELPEVETVVRDLHPRLTGATIVTVQASSKSLRRPWRSEWNAHLVGRQIESIQRHSKWIVFNLAGKGGDTSPCTSAGHMVVHLGMTGQLRIHPAAEPAREHTHLILGLDHNRELRFRDVRRFGSATWFADPQALLQFFDRSNLGPEPFGLKPAYWRKALARTSRRLKAVLLDQCVVAGVGNIYADEALFQARLYPGLRGLDVAATSADRLRWAIATVLQRAIEKSGSTIRDYVDGSGRKGGYQEEFLVYGRTGQPCRLPDAHRPNPPGRPLDSLLSAVSTAIGAQRMSYRAFKRLLGETSLERKCRFLFGAFILLLIFGSFSLYLRQTEPLLHEQIRTTCRLLVIQIIDRDLATTCRPVQRSRLPEFAASTSGLLGAPDGAGAVVDCRRAECPSAQSGGFPRERSGSVSTGCDRTSTG